MNSKTKINNFSCSKLLQLLLGCSQPSVTWETSLTATGLQIHLPGTTLFPGLLVRVSGSLSINIKAWKEY